jgi:hypothetical protein
MLEGAKPGRYRTKVRWKKWTDANGDGKPTDNEMTDNPPDEYSPITTV